MLVSAFAGYPETMHTLLLISLILLAGCTQIQQQTADISGLWINQAAIDTAAQGRPLLKAQTGTSMCALFSSI